VKRPPALSVQIDKSIVRPASKEPAKPAEPVEPVGPAEPVEREL